MSAPDHVGRESQEFERLVAAHANRELTRGERLRLDELVQRAPSRAVICSGIERVHALLERERELGEAAVGPLDPLEEIGENWERLARTASLAGEQLRARLRHGSPPAMVRRPRVPRWLLGAAAAVLLAAAGSWMLGSRSPESIPQAPSPEQLGGSLLLVPELSVASPRLAWHAVPNAVTYRAVISDAAGDVVLRRPDAAARSTQWDLTADEIAMLERAAPVMLRVVALDGDGGPLQSSGDLQLALRR